MHDIERTVGVSSSVQQSVPRRSVVGCTPFKIAYHNPWTNSAENQLFRSMRKAGMKNGIELVECADEEDILACHPTFVLSVTAVVPKVTDFPTYLTVHTPKSCLLEQPQYVKNLLSYDGYLTISVTLRCFMKDLTFGAG